MNRGGQPRKGEAVNSLRGGPAPVVGPKLLGIEEIPWGPDAAGAIRAEISTQGNGVCGGPVFRFQGGSRYSPTTWTSQRRSRERSSSMKRTRCHVPRQSSPSLHRDRLAGGAEQHRHAVRVPVAELHVLGTDVLRPPVPVVVRVVLLARHEAAQHADEVLEEAGLELVHAHHAGRVRGIHARDPVGDAALERRPPCTSSVMSRISRPPLVRRLRSAWKTFMRRPSLAYGPQTARSSGTFGPILTIRAPACGADRAGPSGAKLGDERAGP